MGTRLLVVSSVLPGSENVGGIILGDLLKAYGLKDVCLFHLPPVSEDDQQRYGELGISIEMVHASVVPKSRKLAGRLGSITRLIEYQTRVRPSLSKVVAHVVRFARAESVSRILLVLDCPVALWIGKALTAGIGIPVYALVWDHPDYVLTRYGVDRYTKSRVIRSFAECIRGSVRTAVVSEVMQQEFSERYGANAVILRHAVSTAASEYPRTSQVIGGSDAIRIGFAGSCYALTAWQSLLDALCILDWRVGNNPLILRTLGDDMRFRVKSKASIEHLGWRDVSETVRLLSECSVNYLPQPFESWLDPLSRYSFPTKFSTYLAAGRPVLIHAPAFSALTSFCETRSVGPVTRTLSPQGLADALKGICTDSAAYQKARQEVRRLAGGEFSVATYRDRVLAFLG